MNGYHRLVCAAVYDVDTSFVCARPAGHPGSHMSQVGGALGYLSWERSATLPGTGTRYCTCTPVNRAPFVAVCGSCNGYVSPSCACKASRLARAPGHEVKDPMTDGVCQALVARFGDVCGYCRQRCGGAA